MSRYVKDSNGAWHLVAGGGETNYVGTKAAWDLMSSDDKAKYTTADFTDEDGGYIVDEAPTQGSQNVVQSGGTYSAINSVRQALTSISITGTTNNTGSTITKGTYFYLNGNFVKAKEDIANNATFTLNTNYAVITIGGFNQLLSDFNSRVGNIKYLETTSEGLSSNNIGAVVVSALGNQTTAFMGSIHYQGQNFIMGYYYTVGSSHYFTALLIDINTLSLYVYSYLAGTATRKSAQLN